MSVLSTSKVYAQLHDHVKEWSADAPLLLNGDAHPFDGAVVMTQEDITSRSLEPSSRLDAGTLE